MIALRIGVTCFAMPIGFGVILFIVQMKDTLDKVDFWLFVSMAVIMFILGMWSWWGAIRAVERDNQVQYNKFIAQLDELKGVRSDIAGLLNDVVTEIKGLRKDLTGKNGNRDGESSNL